MRADELQTNPLRADEGGSAGILGHFHKGQTMIDFNQRALGPTVDGCEIRADPLPAYRRQHLRLGRASALQNLSPSEWENAEPRTFLF